MIRWFAALILVWASGAQAAPCLAMTMPTHRTNGAILSPLEIASVEVAWSRIKRYGGQRSRGSDIFSGPQTRICYEFKIKGDYLFRVRVTDVKGLQSDWTTEVPWIYK